MGVVKQGGLAVEEKVAVAITFTNREAGGEAFEKEADDGESEGSRVWGRGVCVWGKTMVGQTFEFLKRAMGIVGEAAGCSGVEQFGGFVEEVDGMAGGVMFPDGEKRANEGKRFRRVGLFEQGCGEGIERPG